MFIRQHRVGRRIYTEVCESYRDAAGQRRHRCLARWRVEQTFAEAIGRTQFEIELAARNVASWEKEPPSRPAEQTARFWQRKLENATRRLDALTAVREAGLPADEAAIERVAQAEREKWQAVMAGVRTMVRPPPVPGLSVLAERVRWLATQNDPDVLRAEFASIAAELEALASQA